MKRDIKILCLIVLIAVFSTVIYAMYPVRDDFGVSLEWFRNFRSTDDPTAYNDTVMTFMIKNAGADTDSIWMTDTLYQQTFYADSLFAVRSLHIIMGDRADNDASGDYAFAGGYRDTVSGDVSFSWSSGGKISGDYSVGFGVGPVISGDFSASFGGTNTMSGAYSGAFGNGSAVEQNWSFAAGRAAVIRGDPAYDSVSACFLSGVIDSVEYAFLIGDNVADVLDRNHTFKCGLDSNVFVGYVECSTSAYVNDTLLQDDATHADSVRRFDDGTNAIVDFDNPFMLRGNYVHVGNAGTIGYADGDGDLYVEDELEVDGNLNTGFFYQELVQQDGFISGPSGSNYDFRSGFSVNSSDSFIIDSICVLYYTTQNNVYIDSFEIRRGYTRITDDATSIFVDGTNVGVGTVTYDLQPYITNLTVSYDWRIRVRFWVATSGVAGNGYLTSAKAYCHY